MQEYIQVFLDGYITGIGTTSVRKFYTLPGTTISGGLLAFQ
jgi:hypothetical protein